MRMICLIVNCMKLARYISIYIYSGLLHRSFPRLPTTTYRRIRQTISFSCARSAIWLGMSVLRENAFAAYFACCRIFHIFQQSAHIAFFPHKLGMTKYRKGPQRTAKEHYTGPQRSITQDHRGSAIMRELPDLQQFCLIF